MEVNIRISKQIPQCPVTASGRAYTSLLPLVQVLASVSCLNFTAIFSAMSMLEHIIPIFVPVILFHHSHYFYQLFLNFIPLFLIFTQLLLSFLLVRNTNMQVYLKKKT